jgi:hypothetical protein
MASFYTFYSFKGGVGRSMALANVADLLARRGLRVLAIDFDLEAPGLERYFQVDKTAALANLGLIDLLQSFKKSLSGAGSLDEQAEFRQLDRFIFPVYPQTLPGGGALHLMTAGQREPAAQYRQYALSVRTFDWQDFYYNWQGEAFFDWLRGELSQAVGSREAYDVVLIDSRTGVTEMGGVCAYQLADVIVMMCAANHQNVEGTRAVVQDFRSASVEALRRGRPLSLVVVPARIEQRDDGLLDAFFTRFDSFFKDEVPPAFAELGLTLRDLTIPYQPEYAFEEVVVSDPERREARRQIGGAFDLLANALTLLARAAPDERLYAKLAEAQAAVQAWLAMAHAAPPYLDVPAPEPFDGADEGIDSDEGGGGGWTAARAPALGTPRMTAPSAAADTAMRFDPTRSLSVLRRRRRGRRARTAQRAGGPWLERVPGHLGAHRGRAHWRGHHQGPAPQPPPADLRGPAGALALAKARDRAGARQQPAHQTDPGAAGRRRAGHLLAGPAWRGRSAVHRPARLAPRDHRL